MSQMRSILRCAIATILVGQLASCAGQHGANKSLYALDPGRPSAPPSNEPPQARPASSDAASISREQILQVRGVSIAPPFDGPLLIYRAKDGTYVKDYYSEWVAPPEELFTTSLVDWLSAAAPFAAVVDTRSAAPHRYALETCITSLYGDFRDATKPKVVLTARVYLLDEAAVHRTVAFQNHYDISIPVERASAQELVVGSGRAYRQLLESMSQDLSAFRKTAVATNAR